MLLKKSQGSQDTRAIVDATRPISKVVNKTKAPMTTVAENSQHRPMPKTIMKMPAKETQARTEATVPEEWFDAANIQTVNTIVHKEAVISKEVTLTIQIFSRVKMSRPDQTNHATTAVVIIQMAAVTYVTTADLNVDHAALTTVIISLKINPTAVVYQTNSNKLAAAHQDKDHHHSDSTDRVRP